MEKKCPRCGKVVVVSQEEIAMRDGVVVCPQCLAMFDAEGNLCETRTAGRVRSMPAPETSHNDAEQPYSYCPDCGKPLPANVNFCPYCGIKLKADKASTEVNNQPAAPTDINNYVQQQVAPVASAPDNKEEEVVPTWTPVYPTFHYREYKWGTEPASLRTRIVGYTVIVAQLILLCIVLHQGYLIGD